MFSVGKHVAWVEFVCSLFTLQVRAEWKVLPPMTHSGMCDASGAAALGPNLFVVADDEDNQLRLYRSDTDGPPQRIVDLTAFLKPAGKFPETDLEGAAWLGDKIFWIGSHGRNRDGKDRPNRRCFFATNVQQTNGNVRPSPVGVCYKKLLKDLTKTKNLKPFKLATAATRPPKSKDALNIEGLCAGPHGSLLIGFRNPIPYGLALILPLLNPGEVIFGKTAQFGMPVLLNLGGLGVRDMARWQDKYLILAGAYDTEELFRLYVWNGGMDRPQAIPGIDFKGLIPEALVVYPNSAAFQVLSDDGTLKRDDTDCKHLPDQAQRRFQAVWVTPE